MALIYNYFYGFKKKFLHARVATIVGFIMMFLSSGDVFGDNDSVATKWHASIECFIKGEKACRKKQYDEAIEHFKEAIKIRDDYADAYCTLGSIYDIIKGEKDKAIECYKLAIKFKPGLTIAHHNLGITYAKDKQNYKEAIKCFKKTIKLRPDHVNAHYNMGRAYQDSKKSYRKSIKYFKKAIKLDPNYAKAYHNMGKVYSLRGRKKKAIESHKAAAKLGYEPSQQLLLDNGITW